MSTTIYVLWAALAVLSASNIYMAVEYVRAKCVIQYWEKLFLDARKRRDYWAERARALQQECAKLRKGLDRKHRRIQIMRDKLSAKGVADPHNIIGLESRSSAWYAVCDALDAAAPGWMDGGTPKECAVRAIKALRGD